MWFCCGKMKMCLYLFCRGEIGLVMLVMLFFGLEEGVTICVDLSS